MGGIGMTCTPVDSCASAAPYGRLAVRLRRGRKKKRSRKKTHSSSITKHLVPTSMVDGIIMDGRFGYPFKKTRSEDALLAAAS